MTAASYLSTPSSCLKRVLLSRFRGSAPHLHDQSHSQMRHACLIPSSLPRRLCRDSSTQTRARLRSSLTRPQRCLRRLSQRCSPAHILLLNVGRAPDTGTLPELNHRLRDALLTSLPLLTLPGPEERGVQEGPGDVLEGPLPLTLPNHSPETLSSSAQPCCSSSSRLTSWPRCKQAPQLHAELQKQLQTQQALQVCTRQPTF